MCVVTRYICDILVICDQGANVFMTGCVIWKNSVISEQGRSRFAEQSVFRVLSSVAALHRDPGSGSGEPSVRSSWSSNPHLLMFWYGLVGPRQGRIGLRETIIVAPYEGQWEPWSAPAPPNCPAKPYRATTLHRIRSREPRYPNQVGRGENIILGA